jgi:hypothetical protein
MSDRLETLMAYVDGELAPDARAAFEAQMAADPTLADQVEAHRKLSAKVAQAYAPVLEEPLPLRLKLAAKTANDARAPSRARLWTALAASLVVGVLAGRMTLAPRLAVGSDVPARTALARTLDHGLATESGPVRIGVTFRGADGRWCRTFKSAPDRLAGLACRDRGEWRLLTAATWAGAQDPTYRTAGSDTPASVLAAVDATISGEAADAAQERVARDAGWR